MNLAEVKARPTNNMSHAWLRGAATWLTDVLSPVLEAHAVQSVERTDDALSGIVHLNADPEDIIATIDVVNMYPTLNHEEVFYVLCKLMRMLYGNRPTLATLVCVIFSNLYSKINIPSSHILFIASPSV